MLKEEIPAALEHANTQEVLNWFCSHYQGTISFSTSFSAEDQVLTHILVQLGCKVRFFTLDTGRLFQETYDIQALTVEKYRLELEVFFPDHHAVETMVRERGINLFYNSIENRRLCCSVRKTASLRRALRGMKVWITGLRRDQSVTRNDLQLAGWDEGFELIKVNPLLEWTEEMVWDYIRKNHIPYNTLHDKGYPSIGCLPCTRAIEPGEDIRAGRWWWELPQYKECGLHK